MLCYRLVQGRKESHKVCYPANLAATDWPLKQLLLLHGGSYQTSHWQECASNRLSRYSFFHCPSITLPWAACSHSPKRDHPSSGDSSKSDSEEDIGDPEYVFTDALRREGHTSPTRNMSTIWSETSVLPSPMLSFWYPGSNSGTCWIKQLPVSPYIWLTLCISKRTTPVSRCCWVRWSMTTMDGRS